ncbi:MAG: conjugal transfer protein TraX [Clostridiales Family XIII bacterium]|nr:conjugal transfer protein TraX [Clostridiales Family XIII bacterium]
MLEQKQSLSTNALKVIAVVCMAIDHIPYAFPNASEAYYTFPIFLFHAIGRITAPIFFYLVGVGYGRTRNANRYALRLLVFAALSYVPYIAYFHTPTGATRLPELVNAQNFLDLNVIFTMLIGLLLLRALNEIRILPLKIAACAGCLFAGMFCDYGLFGIAMILCFAYTQGNRNVLAAAFSAIILASLYFNVLRDFAANFPLYATGYAEMPTAFTPMNAYFIVLACQFLPLPLIVRHAGPRTEPEKRPGFLGKWLFYIFYPAHIILLLWLKLWVI